MQQTEFIRRVSESPGQVSWFLGAGASQSAGLPTAWDLIWDLKRRYYNAEENQRVTIHDVQNSAIREKIQSFMGSRGFPEPGDPTEYTKYFELMFGDDLERQRKYLKAILSEENGSLAVGHRALGALLASKITNAVFTTNFDTVIERAVAEVSGKDLAAFHLEGAHGANAALNNGELPIYVKLHGDFRYQSIKNLKADLQKQNAELGLCFVNACSRWGMAVVGYSGRDESVMQLFHDVLRTPNPFPHGLFWARLKGSRTLDAVTDLLSAATTRGVRSEFVEIETFDSLLLKTWRQISSTDPLYDAKISKAAKRDVRIPVPHAGGYKPIIRSNGIPITTLPQSFLELKFNTEKDWDAVRAAEEVADGKILCTKDGGVWAWGLRADLRKAFGGDLVQIQIASFADRLKHPSESTILMGFMAKALSLAIKQGKPLLHRRWRSGYTLIADRMGDQSVFAPVVSVVGNFHGEVPGLFTKPTDAYPKSEQVRWAEAVQMDIDERGGRFWLLVRPDIWIWPKRAREDATDFLEKKRGDRYNKKADELLSAWLGILLPVQAKGADIAVSLFEAGDDAENPTFVLNSRTAFSRKVGQ